MGKIYQKCFSVLFFMIIITSFACSKAEKITLQTKIIESGSNLNSFTHEKKYESNEQNQSISAERTPVNKDNNLVKAVKTETIEETAAVEKPLTEKSSQEEQANPETTITNKMIRVNGGTFTMGSLSNEQGRASEEGPHRQVTVSSFYMSQYPVTQSEYEKIMGNNPSHFKGPNLPVEQADWYDAIQFCNKKSQRENLMSVYTITVKDDSRVVVWDRNANGYRLPTEAEWEYACRAGTSTMFSFGRTINTNQTNYNGMSPYDSYAQGENRKRTTPVNSFPANPWGLNDMHGNVYEWCWDWFGVYVGFDVDDPDGASFGNNRVLRGGAWDSSLPQLRSASRYSAPPLGTKKSNIGFRIVCGVN